MVTATEILAPGFWGQPPNTAEVSDEWLMGPERREREAYAFHLDGRMWAVVFGSAGPPRAMARDEALMRRVDRELEGPCRVIDRYLWGQATREDFQHAMVAVKAFWEREYRNFRVGEPL